MDKSAIIGIIAIALTLAGVVFILMWMRSKLEALVENMRREMRRNREHRKLGPESAQYSGADHTYGMFKGAGVIALSDTMLRFQMITGKMIAISRDQIESFELKKVFRGQCKGGKPHLVLSLKDGNHVGFIVQEPENWQRRLKKR